MYQVLDGLGQQAYLFGRRVFWQIRKLKFCSVAQPHSYFSGLFRILILPL
jgi:hypothetical protein